MIKKIIPKRNFQCSITCTCSGDTASCDECTCHYIKPNIPNKIDGPDHYGGYQVLELIFSAGYGKGFCLGNALKYIARAEKKGNAIEDLQKAKIYLTYYLDHSKE